MRHSKDISWDSNSPTSRKRKKRFFFPKKSPNFLTNSEFSACFFPSFLQHSYLCGVSGPKIETLRLWQKELFLMEEWKNGRNCVVLVPTSGGKTMVADVAIAQLIDQEPESKALFALPYVSLANEKYLEMRNRFPQHNVRAFYSNIGGPDIRRGNIGICTFERSHSLINSALSEGYDSFIKLVIIDEVHMLGDDNRGPVIESLIIKLLLMRHSPRIILLTATINQEDAQRIARWINGFAYIFNSRSVPISFKIKTSDGNLNTIGENGSLKPFIKLKSSPDDTDHLIPLVRTLFVKNLDSIVLIFVNTRADTKKVANLISKYLYDEKLDIPKAILPSESVLKARTKLIQLMIANSGSIDEITSKCIMQGVMYHHAGLLLEDRRNIEDAARRNILNIIVATTTLSAGVNIHGVSRVIIHNIYRIQNRVHIRISCSQFTQMVGRSGRGNIPGEAIIISRSVSPNEKDDIIYLSKSQIPSISTYLQNNDNMDRFFLQCLTTRLLSSRYSTKDFVRMFFCYFDSNENNEELSIQINNRLVSKGLIESDSGKITGLGKAIAGSSLPIEEAIEVDLILNQASHSLCLDDELHLLYLCAPQKLCETIKPIPYNESPWTHILSAHSHVVKLVTKMSDHDLLKMQLLPNRYGGCGRMSQIIDSKLDKVLLAYILLQLIHEVPMRTISNTFHLDVGEIQSIQNECAAYASQISRFCELSGREVLASALSRFRQRLTFAASSELLSLLSIPSITRTIARGLFEKGISSPVEISHLSVPQLRVLIQPKDSDDEELFNQIAQKILLESKLFAESIAKVEELEELSILRHFDK